MSDLIGPYLAKKARRIADYSGFAYAVLVGFGPLVVTTQAALTTSQQDPDMADLIDDEIVAVLREVAGDGMTISELGRRLNVPWQSLVKRLNRLYAEDQKSRRIWKDGRCSPPIWRAIGYHRYGGNAKIWSSEKEAFVKTSIERATLEEG